MPDSALSPDTIVRESAPIGVAQEAQLGLIRTTSVMMDAFERLLAPFEVTPAQFNVLRILRGAGPCGLGRNQIRDRLITRMADVTRLLERMEAAGLVTRARDMNDRRCVPTQITEKALTLLAQLDPILEAHQRHLWEGFTEAQLQEFIGVLGALRERF